MKSTLLSLCVLGVAAGCGGSDGTGVRGSGDPLAIAREFESLSDSLTSAGNVNGAEVMHHVAEIVKLTGRVTSVEISVDGTPARFLAVAEQMDYPIVSCWAFADTSGGGTAPPGRDGGGLPPDTLGMPPQCEQAATDQYSVRTLIAWQPESMQRIVRIVADTGPSRAPDEVPDVMAGLPTGVRAGTSDSVSADSGVVFPAFYPGFFGEYFDGPGGWWVASQGEESNLLDSMDGACMRDTLELDWGRFACERASVAFEVSMTVVPGFFARFGDTRPDDTRPDDPRPDDPRDGRSHTVKMRSQVVAGVRLRLEAYPQPPLPGPEPITPVLPSSLGVTTDGDSVALTFRASNDTLPELAIGFRSGQRYDFEIYTADGELLWRWSDRMAFTAVLGDMTLRRGESLTYVERWKPASATPRDYVAVAWLASYNVRASSRVAFRR